MYRRTSNNNTSSSSTTPKLPPISNKNNSNSNSPAASSSASMRRRNSSHGTRNKINTKQVSTTPTTTSTTSKSISSSSSSSVQQTQQKLHSQLLKHHQSFNPQDNRPILTLELGPDVQNSVFASLADYLFENNNINLSSSSSSSLTSTSFATTATIPPSSSSTNNNNSEKTSNSSNPSKASTRTEAKWISSRVKINNTSTNPNLPGNGITIGNTRQPCCIQLSGINLFLGVKSTTERLVTEAGVVCNRVRRNGGHMPVCLHMERKDKLPDAEYTSYPNRIIVAFFPGSKPITLKANMAKSLSDFFNSNFAFRHITPESYIIIPRKEVVNDNFSGGNTSMTTTLTDQRGMWLRSIRESTTTAMENSTSSSSSTWIAKSSHGAKGRDLKIIRCSSSNNNDGCDDAKAPAVSTSKSSSHFNKLCYTDPMEFLEKFDRSMDSNPWVIQKYIDRPLLYNGRKFDLRAWVLLTPRLEVFLYKEGVCRMCSVEYDDSNYNDAFAHLSNNCLQEAHSNFGKHEKGNLLSFDEFDAKLISKLKRKDVVPEVNNNASTNNSNKNNRTLNSSLGVNAKYLTDGINGSSSSSNNKFFGNPTLGPLSLSECLKQQNQNQKSSSSSYEYMSFNRDVLPQMKRIIGNCFSSIKSQILPVYDMGAIDCFQYFGFDFMLDSSMKLWLLEVNGAAGVADYLLRPTIEDLAETVVYDMLPQSRPPDSIQQELRRKRPNWFVKIFGKEDW